MIDVDGVERADREAQVEPGGARPKILLRRQLSTGGAREQRPWLDDFHLVGISREPVAPAGVGATDQQGGAELALDEPEPSEPSEASRPPSPNV